MIRPVSPVTVNPAQTDEQGRGLPGAHPAASGGLAPLPKPLGPDIGSASAIASSIGTPSQHLNQHQWPRSGSGEPESAPAETAEGGAAATEGAAGAGELAEVLPLLAL